MSDHSMPLLIVNMGGEMLYILEQRLQAQAIVEEKSIRVLVDVINTMFSEKFLIELFKPQRLYSPTSTRQIFDRLAHSSIMRLNQSSMDKLYDLMCMGCKYEIISISSPIDLLSISMNHLDSLRKLISNNNSNTETSKLVESTVEQLINLFKQLKFAELFTLRQTLARFFQDRRVKVSLFLQDNIQQSDGNIIISNKGKLPKGTEKPGFIRYFNTEGKVDKEEVIKLKNAEGVTFDESQSKSVIPNDYISEILKTPRQCELGTNLYAKDRRKLKTINAAGNAAGQASNPNNSSNNSTSKLNSNTSPSNQFSSLSDENSKKAAKAELNLLAQMIGGGNNSSSKNNIDKFHIVNLFPDTQLDERTNNNSSSNNSNSSDFITFSLEDSNSRHADLEKRIGNMGLEDNNDNTNNNDNNGDDLLSLMDSA